MADEAEVVEPATAAVNPEMVDDTPTDEATAEQEAEATAQAAEADADDTDADDTDAADAADDTVHAADDKDDA